MYSNMPASSQLKHFFLVPSVLIYLIDCIGFKESPDLDLHKDNIDFTIAGKHLGNTLKELINFTTTFTIRRFSTYVFRDLRIAPFKMEISPIVFEYHWKT